MNDTTVLLSVRAIPVRDDVPAATRDQVADLVAWLVNTQTTLTVDDVLSLNDYRIVVQRSTADSERDVLAGELRALEAQLAAAHEYQLELNVKLDLQREEARRAVERAHLAEVKASGAHVGHDC